MSTILISCLVALMLLFFVALAAALMYRKMYQREALWNRYLLIFCFQQQIEGLGLDDEPVIRVWLN